MFGLSLGGQLIQGSAERTWNCISQIANLVWYKFNNIRQPIMPRQRRRHHSRSRSRSRSHSHDKDRDAKRRKIELYESPNHKRSVSPDVEIIDGEKRVEETNGEGAGEITQVDPHDKDVMEEEKKSEDIELIDLIDSDSEPPSPQKIPCEDGVQEEKKVEEIIEPEDLQDSDEVLDECTKDTDDKLKKLPVVLLTPLEKLDAEYIKKLMETNPENVNGDEDEVTIVSEQEPITPLSNKNKKPVLEKTPIRKLTPSKMKLKLQSEEKRRIREKEREEREKQKQDERDKKNAELLKKKEQKEKEKEEKDREKEQKRIEKEERDREKEQKRLEKEKKDEQRRKEKEEEKQRKQQEIDEKNREKQKEEEKKQKAAAAFVNFFVTKKVLVSGDKKNVGSTLAFVPFEIKSDMKLPPPRRKPLTESEKSSLINYIENNVSDHSYLVEIKSRMPTKCSKTWPCKEVDCEVTIIEDDEAIGEKIYEETHKKWMRAKFFKFHENQRPAYYGTWRKKSECITGRKPFGKESVFDYEVDSDDDWEEEEQGENLEVLSDDDKENEQENDDYEVDNEFFVPHGHLSDDEVDDEETSRLSPESQKQKLKLLKDAFDVDIKSKTQKLKPRAIGCVWCDRENAIVDDVIRKHLSSFNVITDGQVEVKKRESEIDNNTVKSKKISTLQPFPENLMPILLKLVHGSVKQKKVMAAEFVEYVQANNEGLEISKNFVMKHIKSIGKWSKNDMMLRKYCWMVDEKIAEKFCVDLVLPNVWDTVKNSSIV